MVLFGNVNTKKFESRIRCFKNCQNFTQISNNPLFYVPFAYFQQNGGELTRGPQGPG